MLSLLASAIGEMNQEYTVSTKGAESRAKGCGIRDEGQRIRIGKWLNFISGGDK